VKESRAIVWKSRFILAVTTIFVSLGGAAIAQVCSQPEYRAFDFWAGDWEVFEVEGQNKVADARVDLILDGCVLHEDYRQSDGMNGQSLTIYDAVRHVWHQSWVTNRGKLLEIEGQYGNGEIVLSGTDQSGALVRGIWRSENGNVRETAVTSSDSGKTWKPWFEVVFRPRKATSRSSPSSEADVIKDLDTRYQKAVEQNDAATMDTLLAEDFMLVTGSGKAYTKADLLSEASSGRIHYDRQDDEGQTVRTWGDTAVISAKLTAKGSESGKPFEYQVWFSDTYVKTRTGWRYVFGQSSLPVR
jgi:ketosteroid isomerase-like protein